MLKFLLSSLNTAFKGLLSLIYKENCCICGCSKDNLTLCKSCAKTVEILSPFPQALIDGVEVYSACLYEGTVRTLIHKLKFCHRCSAAPVLAEILNKYFKNVVNFELKNNPLSKKFENLILVPVPTHKTNVLKRGYNNVLEISKYFAKLGSLPLNSSILTKIKNTKPQFTLNKDLRKTNVEGCFGVNLKNYNNQTLLIIDDIITTGATLGEAIRVLKEAGVKNIICLTVSKAV